MLHDLFLICNYKLKLILICFSDKVTTEHQSDIVHLVNPDDICLEIKKELSQDSDPFINNSDKENKCLTNKNHNSMFESYLGVHLKNKSPDCVLYSEDGGDFATFKEILCQTNFL